MNAEAATIEKRVYPRIPLFRSMSVCSANGDRVKANLRNLSPDGIQAMCARDSNARLFLTGFKAGAKPPVRAEFNLPVGAEFVDVAAMCQVVRTLVVPDEGIALGLRFLYFEGDGERVVNRFIAESMELA